VLAQSIVSGTMLASIARTANLDYTQTLTGFKWISRVPNLRFGYEEALGYCVDPEAVRDKDGITAALLVVELASTLLEQGRFLQDVLDDLDRVHGVHATAQISVRLADPDLILQVMNRLRHDPPTMVGGMRVRRIDDLERGLDGLPPTDGLRIYLAQGCRVIIRPSGTEPKVKCYLQAVEPATDDLALARSAARSRLVQMRGDVEAWLTADPG
jgi:phosphomannomutase